MTSEPGQPDPLPSAAPSKLQRSLALMRTQYGSYAAFLEKWIKETTLESFSEESVVRLGNKENQFLKGAKPIGEALEKIRIAHLEDSGVEMSIKSMANEQGCTRELDGAREAVERVGHLRVEALKRLEMIGNSVGKKIRAMDSTRKLFYRYNSLYETGSSLDGKV
ncbi:MAG: hypothetical protein JKX97_06095 [Candidatus Lindowbacteria bacterium]|nr:hypothetical protein [Candidatus Lindowbacteria bacterium]